MDTNHGHGCHQNELLRISVSMDAPCDRRAFEVLLRKLLKMKRHPAILILHWWSPILIPAYYKSAEDEMDVIAKYYGTFVVPRQLYRIHLHEVWLFSSAYASCPC
jgi:hypothetical protein